MQIGLKRGTVAVEPHRIEWETAAQEIINKLKNILKDDIIDAQHIGSTSIKNICAKPIVDIAVGVSSFDKIIKHNEDLKKMVLLIMRNTLLVNIYMLRAIRKIIYGHIIFMQSFGDKRHGIII